LRKILDRTRDEGLYRVIMIHHPPVRGAAPAHKRLFGISTFQKVIARHGAELVLHGHTHLPTLYWIKGKDGPVPVVGVAAGGENHGTTSRLAQWNLIEIERDGDHFRTWLTRRGLVGQTGQVAQLSREELIAPGSKAPGGQRRKSLLRHKRSGGKLVPEPRQYARRASDCAGQHQGSGRRRMRPSRRFELRLVFVSHGAAAFDAFAWPGTAVLASGA
jgi:hypothetical protein